MDETNGQAETIALGCESLLGEAADIVVGCRRHGASVHLEDDPSPTQGPGNLQPLQQAEAIVSFCLVSF